MGADVQIYKIKATNKKEIEIAVNDLRNGALYDYGHSGYTGTIAEDNGDIEIVDEAMSEDEFYDEIDNLAKKWGPSIVVKSNKEDNTYYVGGIYSC